MFVYYIYIYCPVIVMVWCWNPHLFYVWLIAAHYVLSSEFWGGHRSRSAVKTPGQWRVTACRCSLWRDDMQPDAVPRPHHLHHHHHHYHHPLMSCCCCVSLRGPVGTGTDLIHHWISEFSCCPNQEGLCLTRIMRPSSLCTLTNTHTASDEWPF